MTEKHEATVTHPHIQPGMTVRVHTRIMETNAKGEEKERIQVFEGIILAMRGAGMSKSFVVRKVSNGVGVERIFPLATPLIAKIEPVKLGRVRRAKLWYLRNSKKRLKEKMRVSQKA